MSRGRATEFSSFRVVIIAFYFQSVKLKEVKESISSPHRSLACLEDDK